MTKRINIVLPEATIQAIGRITKSGQRSSFINRAVQHYLANRSSDAIRQQLERAAIRDRDLEREIAADWAAVDNETWPLDEPTRKKPATRRGAKSISRRSTQR